MAKFCRNHANVDLSAMKTPPAAPGAFPVLAGRRASRRSLGPGLLPLDPARYAPSAQRPVRVKCRTLSGDMHVVPHSHAWAQLVFSATGVVRVTAGRGTYIVPPSRAVWIPAGVEHAVTVIEDAELRTVYVHQAPGQCGPAPVPSSAGPWQVCRVLEVTALLRELVLQMDVAPDGDTPGLPLDAERERLLSMLVLHELDRARPLPLGVALPQDKRLRALCDAVLEDPARHATLGDWARHTGASPRTVARLFRQELGTTFLQWRQQVVLAQAVSLAARKRPMSHIASALGYASPSAFSAMVTRAVGMPPSRFFANGA